MVEKENDTTVNTEKVTQEAAAPVKAEVKEHQQKHSADLGPALYLFGKQVREHEEYADNAAVEVGQALLEAGFDGAAHVARHLPHGVQQA